MFNRILKLLVALSVAVLSISAATAFTLISDEGRFTVEMPGQPSFKVRRIVSKDGVTLESNEWMVDEPWLMWLVSYRDYPTTEDSSSEKIFGRLIRELPEVLDGELRGHRFIEHDGIRGLEIMIFVPRNRLLLRSHVFVVRRRQYVISYVGAEGTENEPKVESYLNSFHLLR